MVTKTERNCRVQGRFDTLVREGNHGFYETIFAVVHEEVEAEREACAKICDLPPDLEDRDILGGEEGAELCRSLAASIRMRSNAVLSGAATEVKPRRDV